MPHIVVDVPIPQLSDASLPKALIEPIVEHIVVAVPAELAQTIPQERIVVDAPMPQARENIDIAIDVSVPQILNESREGGRQSPQMQEQTGEVVRFVLQERVSETFHRADHGRAGATDRRGNR